MANGPWSTSALGRAVVLSRDASFCPPCPVQCVAVACAYEAAAEILAAPTLALVVDLRALARRHLRLLEIARHLGVEILASGPLPAGMNAGDLGGVRLIALADLPAELGRLAAAEPRPVPAPTLAVPEGEPSQETPGPLPETSQSEIRPAEPEEPPPRPAAPPAAHLAPAKLREPAAQTPSLDQVLTSEELSALLENQP
ncbi:MAG: hypothetical protein ACE15C_21075 [Phycisphaerae bacterium]